MHGLMNRAIQCFVRDTYGDTVWAAITREARLGFDSFEPMLAYDTELTIAVIDAAARLLDRPRETLLEDLGTYLVSHPNLEALRRLLRFGGVDFQDFLQSMEDMRGRGHLALPDLELPELELTDTAPGQFELRCRFPVPGAGHVIMGLLRAMADDYGALVLLEHRETGTAGEVIEINLLETRFAEGKRFDLAARAL
jgi:hypothetical protein